MQSIPAVVKQFCHKIITKLQQHSCIFTTGHIDTKLYSGKLRTKITFNNVYKLMLLSSLRCIHNTTSSAHYKYGIHNLIATKNYGSIKL